MNQLNWRKWAILALILSLPLVAQSTDVFQRNMNNGASLPGTCRVGDTFFRRGVTAGQNVYGCTATNTWTLQAGGGGTYVGGLSGTIIVSGSNIDVDTAAICMKTAGCVVTGSLDLSGASTTKPMKSGTTPPATCAVGEFFYDTDATAGSNTLGCTATNTWTLQGGGGGSDTPAANANITAASATISCSSPTVQVTPNANYILSSGPTISNGSDGQVCEIWNLSTTYSVLLADESTLASTNIYARDRLAVVIPPVGSARLRYSSSLGAWIEISTTGSSQSVYSFFDDFCLSAAGWTLGSIGGEGSSDGSVCAAAIAHNAVFGSGALFQRTMRTAADFLLAAKSNVKIQQATNTGFRWGIYDGNGYAAPSNGVYVEKLTGDTNVFAVCNASGTSTRTALAAADGNYHTYSIVRVSASDVRFYMDATGVSVTTNCPASLSGYRQGYQFGVSDATLRVLWSDWTKVVIPR